MRKRFSALMVLVGLLVGLMPLMGLGATPEPAKKCYAQVETHDWVRYRVQKTVWDTGLPYNGGSGAGAAYWVGEGSSSVTSHSPLTINPQGDHDAPRVVDVSRFNVVGGDYVASATGTYFYKLLSTETKTQPTKPNGDGWIDLGGKQVQGDQIPCIEIQVSKACGVVYGSVKTNNTPFAAGVRGVEGTDLPPLANWQTESFSLNGAAGKTFPEDYNGGSVVVTVFVVGPEQDYYAVNGFSVIFKTVTVNTDCEPNPVVTYFEKEWTGDDLPDGVEVTFLVSVNGGDPQEVPDGHGIAHLPGDTVELVSEIVTGLPENCDFELVEQAAVLSAQEQEPQDEVRTVTNDLDCEEETTTTTTVVDEETTTTVSEETTTTVTDETTTTVKVDDASTTTIGTTTTTVQEIDELPYTGATVPVRELAIVGISLLVAGVGLIRSRYFGQED